MTKRIMFVLTFIILITTLMPYTTVKAVNFLDGYKNIHVIHLIVDTPTGLVKISPDNNPLPAFKWNGVAGASSYEVKMDSGSWVNIGNKLTYIQPIILGKGAHSFYIRAKDVSGNTGPVVTLNFAISVTADLNNTKIAVSHGRELLSSEIYAMARDFSNRAILTNNTVADQDPAWSPDGSKLAFYSGQGNNQGIYIMNVDDLSQIGIVINNAINREPAWSPDGAKIAFSSNRDGNFEIYVMNANGSNQTRITYNNAYDVLPSWSPDGNMIAFSSNRSGNWEIYVMNSDGSNLMNLTNNIDREEMGPAWSPNGSKILYETHQSGNYSLQIMNPDGSNQTDIIPPGVENYSLATWSPDGSKIVVDYAETIGHSWTIAIVNADGSDKIVLQDSRPWGHASWSPFLESVPSPDTQKTINPTEYRWSTVTTPSSKWDPPGKVFWGWQQVRLKNSGKSEALNVKAKITCKPANVTVLDGTVSFPNIPAGSSVWSTDDFALATDMTIPSDPKQGIVWQLEFDDTAGNHYVIQNVPQLCGLAINCVPTYLWCPDSYKWSTVTTPSSKWDPPGKVFKGWQQVRLKNNGTIKAFNVKAKIICKPVNVTVLDGNVSFPDIAAGGSAWSINDFALKTDMTNPQDPKKGIVWQVEFDDAASGGKHYVIYNVPYLCGQAINCP